MQSEPKKQKQGVVFNNTGHPPKTKHIRFRSQINVQAKKEAVLDPQNPDAETTP
jgi:hypothetical protein